MDVEGTDGVERGSDQAFERQSALFVISLAKVLLVNLWFHDVGRYSAANMPLLEIIFELNLRLFRHGGDHSGGRKTSLLFVIRDAEPSPTLEVLSEKITTEMDGVWERIEKPDELKDSKITDFFDLHFTSLPHKVYKPDEWLAGVDAIRDRFWTPGGDETLLAADSSKTAVPAVMWADYAEEIWDTVRSNKDLDLPSAKEAVATARCEALAVQSVEDATAALTPYRQAAGSGELEGEVGGAAAGAVLSADAARDIVRTAARSYGEGAMWYVFSLRCLFSRLCWYHRA